MTDLDVWISQAEAARLRRVSPQAISELVKKGRFRTLEIGGKLLVHREDVVKYRRRKGGRPRKDRTDDS